MNTAFARPLSYLYRRGRQNVIEQVYEKQYEEGRARDLEEVVEIGDKKLKALPQFLTSFPIPKDIGVQFHDLYFPFPLTLAAFKDDLEIIEIWMRLGLGGACIKTVMKEPREGNPRPRLQEVTVNIDERCLLNAMGLPGHGVEGKIEELEQAKMFRHGRPLGISIGGSSVEEYKEVFDKLNAYLQNVEDRDYGLQVWFEILQQRPRPAMSQQQPTLPIRPPLPYYFEVNISCPNTPEGQQMSKHPELLEELVKYMRTKTDRVIGAKLSPDSKDKELIAFAEMLMPYGKVYVNLGNTTFRKCVDVDLRQDAITKGGGGLSGPALYNRTLEMVEAVAPTGIAICATGGIDSAEKVHAVQRVGYEHNIPVIVGMATAVVKDMYCIPRINRELAKRPMSF